ncbi:MAG: NarK/NasA family nitrate transporter [Planctomycetia bacterium]|nr:NarK/NasA family nitrate transporter [Planctomycetia bacterium]
MHLRAFLRSGHTPTLACAFWYFDVSFMVWMLIGALANSIAPEFSLSDAQKGLLVAVPVLGGALLRLPLGYLADRFGPRRTALAGLLLTLVPLLLGWLWAASFARLLCVGFLLGVAGASFAVALPMASRWYPPRHQGLALGIAGAGNSGTALATFFGPRVAEVLGWRAVFGLAALLVAASLLIVMVFAKESPQQPPPKRLREYFSVLRQRDAWWFCFFYSVTFGGFVGLASFVSIFFKDQYDVSRVAAGTLATACVFAGSLLRPVGGYLADRLGGTRVLAIVFVAAAVVTLSLAALPVLSVATAALMAIMGLLGIGNGAVFQLVPQRFAAQIGVVTGIVGAAGGLGGFVLPSVLSGLKETSGSFSGGFVFAGLIAMGASVALLRLDRAWRAALAQAEALSPSAVPAPSPSSADI